MVQGANGRMLDGGEAFAVGARPCWTLFAIEGVVCKGKGKAKDVCGDTRAAAAAADEVGSNTAGKIGQLTSEP